MEAIVKNTLENLERNQFVVKYFEDIEEAVDNVLEEIPKEASVGIGGSVTIKELEIYEKLINRGNEVYWHHKCQPHEKKVVLKKAAVSDIYLSSTNALTEDGRLINIDGTGNRVAGMVWGHDKIIIIAGINKIALDYEKAMDRIKTIACPKNAERLDLDVPCRYTGKCENCESPQKMCRIITVLDKQPLNGNIHVYLINEELGY